MSTEYICPMNYDDSYPNDASWVAKLLELGLHRESFNLTYSPTGRLTVKFWEPDRLEALRILGKLDEILMEPPPAGSTFRSSIPMICPS
jgi:hypothetical protein